MSCCLLRAGRRRAGSPRPSRCYTHSSTRETPPSMPTTRHPRPPLHYLRLQQARAALQRGLRRAQSEWVMGTVAPVNVSIVGASGSAAAWEGVKQLRTGLHPTPRPAQPKMQKADGTRASTPEENASVFASHFEKLYGRAATFDPTVLDSLPPRDTVPDLDHTPTDEEIRRAVRRLNNTAPGDSGVPAQLFKALASTDAGFNVIRTMVLGFWETGDVPAEWETGLLAILAKKGDLSQAGNYRGIMMLEVAYKIVANLLHARLEPIMEKLDHEAQCGFRRWRGCSDAIFTVRQLLSKRREHGLETWVLFIDLVKAFDRVPRELLWKVLLRYGVPPKLVELLVALHASVLVKFEIDGVLKTLLSVIGVKLAGRLARADSLHFLHLRNHGDMALGAHVRPVPPPLSRRLHAHGQANGGARRRVCRLRLGVRRRHRALLHIACRCRRADARGHDALRALGHGGARWHVRRRRLGREGVQVGGPLRRSAPAHVHGPRDL